MSVILKINEELNGIELYFDNKPNKEVRENLKANKFRYHGLKNCWYARQNASTLQIANTLTNSTESITSDQTHVHVKKQSKNTLSLWDACQFTDLNITQETKEQDVKLIAKEIRTHIRKRFPQCKFSVTTGGSYLYSKIDISIKSSPFEKGSVYLNSIREYCSNLLNAYNHTYDAADPYTDYAGSYNFYGHAEIDWEYTQTDITEDTQKDMNNFDTQLAEHEKAEKERKDKEFQEYLKQEEIRNEEYKKQQEEEKKQTENIYNSITVNELKENNQYFITGAEFANLNKNNTLDRYKEEVSKGDYYLNNVKVTKEIHFSSLEALTNFSNMLLHDFDFLTNTGGSFTDDNRINSMTDYHNMDEYERKTVEWNLYGVAIYFNNKLQFVVDAQGYSYARYVGLTDNATVQKSITVDQVIDQDETNELKQQADQLEDISVSVIEELNILTTWNNENWKEYKNAIKTKLKEYNFKLTKQIIQQLEIEELKTSMYKILQEVDGIQDQFSNAPLEQGEKLTLFYISDFGSIVTNRITFDSVEPSKYAQYDNAIKLTFTPEKQRKLHYKHFYSTLLIYKGFHALPKEVLHHVEEKNGMRITRSKYHSCDNRQYDEILNYFNQQGIEPLINTYKPIF